MTNERFAKGAVWGDYDDDGLLDLFVSNMSESSRLYHNEGNESFKDVTEQAGILTPDDPYPLRASPVCSGILIMTAGWICSSTTGRWAREKLSPTCWGFRPGSRARPGSTAISAPESSAT